MKVTLLLALVATFASANILDSFTKFVEDHTLTKQQAYDMTHQRKVAKLSASQQQNAQDAHHRIQAHREALGLPLYRGRDDWQAATGFISVIMGIVTGLMYHPNSYNPCYNAIESSFLSWDTFGVIFGKAYMPWYWSQVQYILQDTIVLNANLYSVCDIDKALVTMTSLITVEGLSELGSRAVGAIFFEYSDLLSAFGEDDDGNPINSTYEKGEYVGRAVSVTLSYTI